MGSEQLARNLENLGKQSIPIIRRALAAGAREIAGYQRRAVPRGQSDVRAAIGSRVVRGSGRMLSAKAGGGVGKPRAPRLKKRAGRRPGVGISSSNIHWYLLGTGPRWTGSRSWKVKGGRRSKRTGGARAFRGRMPSHLFLRQAAMAGAGPANLAMRAELTKGINQAWARRNRAGSRY